MGAEVVTKEDLQVLRIQIVADIKAIISSRECSADGKLMDGYKTKDVRRILGCSVNKLVSLRIARKIRWKKIGGTVYYNREDVKRLLEEGY